jgi:hypothetical protein
MLSSVPDEALVELQKEHNQLIGEYEEIIKEKIQIFTEMIGNLNIISKGNV